MFKSGYEDSKFKSILFLFRHFSVVGILKMGWKKLYLYNKAGSQSEAMVFCLLDFYIHENKQRKGYGKHLFEYMLQVLYYIVLVSSKLLNVLS